jgi:uncharacterized membrane protein YcaP (DUF421 family)
MFAMQLPLFEKILRPIIVYLFLIFFLRLFGKRELAQLNPLDLVVLLSLSNTVQNAMIGNDNSVSGGIIGAFALLAINWILMRILFRMPKLNQALEGTSTTLITNGIVDEKALASEALTREELLQVLHKQNFNDFHEIKSCVLEPSGTFYVEGVQPTAEQAQNTELMEALARLTRQIEDLRAEVAGRNPGLSPIA